MKEVKSTVLSRRLVKALKKAKVPNMDLPDDRYGLLGFNHGHHQKSAGAWAWQLVMLTKDDQGYWPLQIGSADPASSLRSDSKIGWYRLWAGGGIEVSIEPEKKHDREESQRQ